MIENKIKILIVEDEILTAEELKNQLIDAGYEADIEYAGEDAVIKAIEYKPDLVIMDIVLRSSMDGIQTAEIIKSRRNVPIIYLTAYLDDTIISRAKYSSPYTYLSKPYKLKDLLAAVQAALQKHEEHGKIDSIVTHSMEKVVKKLQNEVNDINKDIGNIKDDVQAVKDVVNGCANKIEKFNIDFATTMTTVVNKQFSDFFGDPKEHIIEHEFIRKQKENSRMNSKAIRTSIISIVVTVIGLLLLYGIINWHGSLHNSAKSSQEINKEIIK